MTEKKPVKSDFSFSLAKIEPAGGARQVSTKSGSRRNQLKTNRSYQKMPELAG
ncbi:MAG: hypothetical protein KA000_01920 [Candidatus Saccharicenans sp.]|nr:hypothetical protein [Candidatus Saccharicenans sp.]NMC65731.1 hypothetical protein [Acidobacteriota bacterium]